MIVIDNLCNSSPHVMNRALQVEHDVAPECEDAWRWQSMNPTDYST